MTFWCPYERPLGEGESFLHSVDRVMGLLLRCGAASPAHAGGDRLLRFGCTRAADGCLLGANRRVFLVWAAVSVLLGCRRAIFKCHASTGLTHPLAHYYLARQKTLPGPSGSLSQAGTQAGGYFNAALSLVLQAAAAARARLYVRSVPILIY